MGRRSNFERWPQDRYDTPAEAVEALLPHLKPATRFIEPCLGNGHLIEHLTRAGHVCVDSSDSEVDARSHRYDLDAVDAFITNHPGRKDDSGWYLFNRPNIEASTVFIGRKSIPRRSKHHLEGPLLRPSEAAA